MKNLITVVSIVLFTLISNAQSSVSTSDFEILDNTNWKGTLTYLDYQSGELSSIDTNLQVEIEGNKVKSNLQYVYEPHKNNKSSVQIKKNGTYYGKEKIVSNTLNNALEPLLQLMKEKIMVKKLRCSLRMSLIKQAIP